LVHAGHSQDAAWAFYQQYDVRDDFAQKAGEVRFCWRPAPRSLLPRQPSRDPVDSAAEACDNSDRIWLYKPRRITMWNTRVLSVLGGVAYTALTAAFLFGSAGRADLPMFWAYLGVWTALMLVSTFVVDPSLAKERLRPGPGGKDYATLVVATLFWPIQCIVAGLDVGRFHWSDNVPLAGQVIGLLAMAAGMAVTVWAAAVNRFFSSVIRIQTDRGHHLVTRGPYQFVRHPAYAASPFFLIGGSLALGSWSSALVSLLLVVMILRRTAQEDRFLREELEGYAAYAEKVRYRILPGVW
jgi:protein-S-isoprenylcysteine O-methyltransferase Ste14